MFAKLMLIALVCFTAYGQPPTPTLEVASIKPATALGPLGMRADRTGGPGTSDPGMYACRNCPISWVLSEAYDLQPFEFSAPDWLQSARFDFLAKVPPGTTKAAFRIMLQSLLTDRFKMTVHREKKEMPLYELTVARNGPKFREALPKDTPKEGVAAGQFKRDAEGFPILTEGMTMAVAPGHARIRSDNQPISWFVRMLSGQLHRPVIDATALMAKYDFVVSWSFEENGAPVGSAAGDAAVPAMDPYRPALINAVQSQLGLKLEQKKGYAEVLVVDHIEKAPSSN